MIIKSDRDSIKNYFEDSSNLKGGHAEKVVIPENVKELSSFLKDASSKKMPVTVSGGGTGTTGSRIPFGGIVLSTERFDRILDISADKMSATVETGVLVEGLKDSAWGAGLFYTSHPTEKSASVGGTVATNASGARSFKYGPTRKYVKRLKMVLADGSVLDIVRGEKFLTKNNSSIRLPDGREIKIPLPRYKMPDIKSSAGYFAKDGVDLIDLFIGQEGTLSVIAEIELSLVKKPAAIFSCFVFFKTEADAWSFSDEIKNRPDSNVLSVEYFDHNAVNILRSKNTNVPAGMAAAIFFEQDKSGRDPDKELFAWEKIIAGSGSSLDATWVAMSEKDAEAFTKLRYAIPESVNEIIRHGGFKKISIDCAVPGDKFLELMKFYVSTFDKERLPHVIFGHIGENHLHVNILPGSGEEASRAEELSLVFVRKAVALGGTVSAEHGIGKLKHRYLLEMYGREGILDMVRIKKALDPACILGLDNLFPKENLI